MFSKVSRYRKAADVVITDVQGRTLATKELRLLPAVTGSYEHTVAEVDRLDHLAYRYYQQPRKWWRICDANPQFLAPQALLGQDAIVQARFPLVFGGAGQPPWAAVTQSLLQQLGVERVGVVDDVQLAAQQHTSGGQTVTVQVEQHTFSVLVTYNRCLVAAEELAALIAAEGFDVSKPQLLEQVGKKILIPPDTVS